MAKKDKSKKRVPQIPKTKKEAIAQARRYFSNAKDTLINKTSIKNDRYVDSKYVSEASAMGYLAATIAIKGYLLEHGIVDGRHKLPKSYDQYTMFIKKVPKNGKLMAHYNTVYENLHIAGYYEGYCNVKLIKGGFESAQKIIEILSN
ncbi:MAG: hypothetical protein FVQ77_13985 [Cytophagales bacterium]|nr:hypothetical protein [Cytophagales bacterium]